MSFSPIDFDEDASGEETIQWEKEHVDAEDVELGIHERPTICE